MTVSPLSPELTVEQKEMRENAGSVAEIADFLFRSFYFSQGNASLQECLLSYGQELYAAEIATLADEDKAEIRRIAAKKASSWVNHGPHVELTNLSSGCSIPDEITETINKFEAFLTTAYGLASREAKDLDSRTILLMSIRDYDWIVREDGRPNRKRSGNSEYNDPYLSHIIYYGLLSNSTRNEAFDFIFRKLKVALLIRLTEQYKGLEAESDNGYDSRTLLTGELKEVFDVYLLHHPDEKSAIEQALAEAMAVDVGYSTSDL